MFLNVLHRPKTGGIYRFFRLQQEWAHSLRLKTTVMATYASMQHPHMVDDMARDHEEHGDEIGLYLGELDCPEFRERFGCPMDAVWLYGRRDKRDIISTVLRKFRECFGRNPTAAGAYHLDASAMEVLTELCPEIEIVVAACFEEGVKVYHGCNNSWYLFNEGGPWSAWYPSAGHTLRPASGEGDAAGPVAVCHLSRDPALSYESRNDYWASHPANVQRGLGNVGETHPYDFNLIDAYRAQEELNGEFAYFNVFVGPNWLTENMNVEDPPEVGRRLYRQQLEYLAELRDDGEVTDLTMTEFAGRFRARRSPGDAQVFLAKEMLYGSGKHYVWYRDADMRVLIDATQGGSIGDLRPYACRFDAATGPDTPSMEDGSYPYLVQSQYRSGAANHAYDGARTTLAVSHGGETVDLCNCPTQCADVERDEEGVHVRLTPARLEFRDGLEAAIETTCHFPGDGRIVIERRLTEASDPGCELTAREYLKACYGTREYPEDLHGVRLEVHGESERRLTYEYAGRSVQTREATAVRAHLPQIHCLLSLEPAGAPAPVGRAEEGFLFSPFFTLILEGRLTAERSMRSCLCLSRAT